MIQYLSSLSFSNYGRVLRDTSSNHGFPTGPDYREEVLTLKKESTKLHYLDTGWLYLDFIDGVTILTVSLEADGKESAYFYLDKAIAISHGVYYSLIPLFDSSTVRWCMNQSGVLISRPIPVHSACLSISRQMSITNIYTIFYQEQVKTFTFKGESHEMTEITYADKGTIHCVVEGVDTKLSQGDMLIIGPNQWHTLYAESDYPVGFITIAFAIQCPFLDLLFNRKFSLNHDSTLLLKKILQEYTTPDMFTNDMIISKLEQLLLTVLRMKNPSMKKLQTSISVHTESTIVKNAAEYITANIYNKLSVDQVAKAMNVSSSHLSMLFKRHLQIPPGTFIRNTKLEESKSLIIKGEHNFSQIAKMLHYTSVYHFSRQFKQHFDATPTEYAKSIHVSRKERLH